MTRMSEVVMQAPQSNVKAPVIQSQPKIQTENTQKIDNSLNAKAKTQIAEKALDKALNFLAEKLTSDLNVSKTLDANGSIKTVSISDGNGRKIVEMPPKAAVAISDRAKERSIGLLLDKIV